MAQKLALEVRGMKKTYATGTVALKGVDMEVPEGGFYALLGPNGAGKSTFINIVSQLVKKSEGSVKIFGVDIDKNPDQAKTYVGLVPQEINFGFFEQVEDIVLNQAGYYGLSRKEVMGRYESLIKDLNLWEKRKSKAMELSGGMKRRLLIARALIHKPKLLILDEPTAGVDVELRRGMWDFLHRIVGEGVTIILTTHYLEEAEQLADSLSIIDKGVVTRQGTVKDLLSGLSEEDFILDLAENISDKDLGEIPYTTVRVDQNTIELMIEKGQTITEAIKTLYQKGIVVKSLRNKANRLETLFLSLTKK